MAEELETLSDYRPLQTTLLWQGPARPLEKLKCILIRDKDLERLYNLISIKIELLLNIALANTADKVEDVAKALTGLILICVNTIGSDKRKRSKTAPW